VVCRQLARDIDWLEHVLRRAAPAQLVRLPSWRQVLGDSLLVLSPRHHFDVQSLSDPWPGLVDLWRIVRRQVQRVAAVLRRRRRLRAECRAARPGGPGRSMLTRAGKVLFLCYGNINRSALAQAHAEARHGGRFVYLSAGFHAQEGRSADPSMVDAAARHGIDLRSWRSRTLTAQMVEQADVILVMELAHIDRLLKQHPAARHKTFLLGASGIANHGIEIPDPYGQAAAVYAQVCQQVVDCVDGWVGGVAEIGGDRQAHGLAVHP
jgi:protein-tyrosine-phosphatase